MSAQTEPAEVEAIAREYFESWFDGDGDRMGRVLHKDLCKRRAGEPLTTITRDEMIDGTKAGHGVSQAHDRVLDIAVLDIHGDLASARVRSAVFYEYLHLLRTEDGWKIANALYERL